MATLALLTELDHDPIIAREQTRAALEQTQVYVNQNANRTVANTAGAPLALTSGLTTSGALISLASYNVSGLGLGDVLEVTASFAGVGAPGEGFNLYHQTDGFDLGTDNSTPTGAAMCRWTLAGIPRNPKLIAVTQFLPTDDGGVGLPGGCWRQQVVTLATDVSGPWTLSLRGLVTGGGPAQLAWSWQVRHYVGA